MPNQRAIALIVAASVLAAAPAAPAAPGASAATSAATSAAIPGPRTCFWYRGPFSVDPYINVAFPDGGAFYWSANVVIPAGAKLRLEGRFPHARYMSFVSYRATGQAVESLPDHQIDPEPGSENPFLDGADRGASKRNYTVRVAARPDDREAGDGKMAPGQGGNTLLAPLLADGSISIVYRIYASDRDAPVTGGAGLPGAVLTLADGHELRGEAACAALDAKRPWSADITALGLPAPLYRTLLSLPGRPEGWPALTTPEWHVQHARPAVMSIFSGDHAPFTGRSGGEFYPNPDNRYLRTFVSSRFGSVLILRGQMPLTPTTYLGDRRMGSGQVRYWSLCSIQSLVNSRTIDCLFDEEVPLDSTRRFVIVASRERDRPRNARPECGLAWLRLPDDDGYGEQDISMLVVRNMLADPSFAEAIQNMGDDKDLPRMGDYLPKGEYVTPNVVETLFPCPLT